MLVDKVIVFVKNKEQAQSFLAKLLNMKKVNPAENLFLDFEVRLRRVNLFSKQYKFKIYYRRKGESFAALEKSEGHSGLAWRI